MAATATFTKWMVGEGPQMVGVAGGVVGSDGTYSGRVLELEPGATTVVRAVYRLEGSDHAFTALMHVEQTGFVATLVGVVTDGWAKGCLVRGEYTEIHHDHDGVTTDAWQGTLDVIDAPIELATPSAAESG